MKLNYKRIHIIGSVGSGKTTLAKQLSKRYEIPYYELDNVVWKRNASGDIRRSNEERDKYLKSIIESNNWIIEGVHNEDWVSSSFKHSDIIIFLDPNYHVRTYRITKRFIKQRLGLEKAHYKPTLNIFKKMFKWNRIFENKGKPNFLSSYSKYNKKIYVVDKPYKVYRLLE